MPLISSSYKASLLFKNGHFNTIYKTLFFRGSISYERERIRLKDGDFLDLDFSRVNSKSLVMVMHGLEGSSNSNYIISVGNFLNAQGMDVMALNFRGCSGEDNDKLFSYNSGKSDDLKEVVNFITTSYSYENIFLLGYSMGGNITLKYLGEGNAIPKTIKGAVTVSVPCDLAGSSEKLGKWYNKLYMQVFLKTLKEKSVLKMNRFPNHNLNRERVLASKDFADFDDAVTAPLFGYKNAKDYWTSCSSKQFLGGIQIPTLLINALDDSFLSASCYPFEIAKNHPYLFLETPKSGGHVGFNSNLIRRDAKWSESRIHAFFQELLNE